MRPCHHKRMRFCMVGCMQACMVPWLKVQRGACVQERSHMNLRHCVECVQKGGLLRGRMDSICRLVGRLGVGGC